MKTARFSLSGLILITAVMSGGLLVGCRGWLLGSQSYREVNYYSLETPAPQPCDGYIMEISGLRMLAAGRNKMVYRDDSCQVLVDEYNKWVQSPSFLVRQYLQTVFAPPVAVMNQEPIALTLKGSVVIFEIDRSSHEVVLGVEYTIQSQRDAGIQLQNSRIIREKFTEESPEKFAEAMSKAAAVLAQSVAKDALVMKQRIKSGEVAAGAPEKTDIAPNMPVKSPAPVPPSKTLPVKSPAPNGKDAAQN